MLTGISPEELLDLDPLMLEAVADAAREERDRWKPQDELLALIAEQVNQLALLYLARNKKKGAPMPKPLRVARPGDEPVRRVSMSEMARMMARR